MKFLKILLLLSASSFLMAETPRKPERPQSDRDRPTIEKPRFPKHWGRPPQIQVRDHVKLPKNFGHGSSTLAKWIADNLKRDASKDKPKPIKPRPDPEPPIQPIPEPPKELREKIKSYHLTQKGLQDALKQKLGALGEKPSREAVRKVVEKFRTDNQDLIEAQKEIGKDITAWHKDNKPARPQRPELPSEVKEKISQVKEKQKEMHGIRQDFHEKLKESKSLSKEAREELIQEFKSQNASKHQALKEAQKELQKEIREIKQTGDRRQ